MRRIGSVFSQSAYSDSILVLGANGPVTRDWADIFYDYFIYKLASQDKQEKYATKNMEFQNGLSSQHVHVYLQRSVGDRQKHNQLCEYLDTLAFELYSTELQTGGLMSDTIDFLTHEMRRIFMRYIPHFIAGIFAITNMTAGSPEPPESEKNPFQGVYKRTVTIDIHYTEQFAYPLTLEYELNYVGGRYSAGSFVEQIEDPT